MAKLNFEQVISQYNQNTSPAYSGGNNQNSVGFFGLKNDGDEAIVRIICESPADFECLSVHPVYIDGKMRMVNCIREDGNSPIADCPLCQAKEELRQRIYIKLIQYTQGADGKIVAEAKVWDRPAVKYGTKLKGYLDNFGPLSDIICKVIRHGAAGNKSTEYEIIPNLNKAIYTDELYPKNCEALNSYKALGRVVVDRDFSDLNTFVTTGVMPAKQRAESSSESGNTYVKPENTVAEQIPTTDTVNSVDASSQPAQQTFPWGSPVSQSVTPNQQGFDRPVRKY